METNGIELKTQKNLHSFSHLILDQKHIEEKTASLTNGVGKTGSSHVEDSIFLQN
jgi:hypothetical protein